MKFLMSKILSFLCLATMLILPSCREEQVIFIPEEVEVTTPQFTSLIGFFVLNEGNMGSNKATLDY